MALAYIDDSLAIFGSDWGTQAQLLLFRAIFEAIGEMDTATRTIARARRRIRSLPAEIVTEVDIFSTVVETIQLRPDSIKHAERSIAVAEQSSVGLAAGTKPWTIAAMHALGMAERSEIWITSLAAYADAANDVFRRADVAALDFATKARAALVEPDEEGLAVAPRNTIARWRVEVTRLYLNLLRRDREGAKTSLAALRTLGEKMNPIWRSGIPAFDAARDAWFDDAEIALPAPLESVSSVTLPAALAGLNASS